LLDLLQLVEDGELFVLALEELETLMVGLELVVE